MQAEWYFDFISPFSYLQLERIAPLHARLQIAPIPIVFGAVLQHHGQLGPAEIRGKREFTYRIVQWTAEREGIALRFPPAHPFNPIAALRLAIAAGATWPVARGISASSSPGLNLGRKIIDAPAASVTLVPTNRPWVWKIGSA